MHRSVVWLAATLTASAPGNAAGQGTERRTFRHDVSHMLDDMVFIWTSPVHMHEDDLAGLAVVAGAFATTLLTDRAVVDWIRTNPNALPVRMVRPLREPSPLHLMGRTHALVPASTVLYLVGLAIEDDDLRDVGIGCITSNVATTLPRWLLASVVGRLRPLANQGPYIIEPLTFGEWEMRSFPGGHGANAMACSSYFNHRFDLGLGGPLLYALATAIGLARVVDEAHWPSDTVFGLAWGFAVGKGVAARLSERATERTAESTESAPRVYLGWKVRFD